MKKIIVALAMICLIYSASYASVLLTANPLGAGKIGLGGALGGGYSYNSNSPSYGIAGLIGYGITNELDIYGKLGYAATVNLPAGTDSINMANLATVLKYTVIKESNSMPVSVAVAGGYSAGTADLSFTGGAKFQAVAGDLGIGVITSKVIVPFVPYAALASHSIDSKSVFSSSTKTQNWELALGSYMFLSKNKVVVCEWSTSMQIDQQPSTAITVGYMQML